MRWPMATWKALNLVVGAYRPDAARSAEWNRGAYLVQGPGHCGACHTPRDWTLATQSSEPLRGAVMQDEVKGGGVRDWYAVDLRATTQGLTGWKTEHIVDYLGKGASARAGSFGPMNAVIANSPRHLRSEDLHAIAVYLQSLRGTDYAGEAVSAEAAQAGGPLYERNCRKCRRPLGPRRCLRRAAACRQRDRAGRRRGLAHGHCRPVRFGQARGNRPPSWEAMPAYALKLDDAEISALSNFLRANWGNRAAPVTPEIVARQRGGSRTSRRAERVAVTGAVDRSAQDFARSAAAAGISGEKGAVRAGRSGIRAPARVVQRGA